MHGAMQLNHVFVVSHDAARLSSSPGETKKGAHALLFPFGQQTRSPFHLVAAEIHKHRILFSPPPHSASTLVYFAASVDQIKSSMEKAFGGYVKFHYVDSVHSVNNIL
jgi:hypothetical protein